MWDWLENALNRLTNSTDNLEYMCIMLVIGMAMLGVMASSCLSYDEKPMSGNINTSNMTLNNTTANTSSSDSQVSGSQDSNSQVSGSRESNSQDSNGQVSIQEAQVQEQPIFRRTNNTINWNIYPIAP